MLSLSLTFLLPLSRRAVSNHLEPFVGDKAKSWRDSNFALTKVVDTLVLAKELYDNSKFSCMTLVGPVPGASTPCIVPLTVLGVLRDAAAFAVKTALSISGKLYTEIVDKKVNGAYAADVTMSMYENIITANKNLFTTFAATQQLKVMLGEISEGLDKADEEEETRRRLQGDCTPTDTTGFLKAGTCTDRSCDDPARFCDGSFYYPFIAEQRGGELFRLPRHVVHFYRASL